MSFARELSRRALSISLDTVPEEAIRIGRRAFADTVGVALAGADAPYLDVLEAVLEYEAAPGQVTLWGRGGRRASILHAALINGTAAHALDFDDCSTTMGGHPSAPVVPVVLGLAEALGRTTGKALEAWIVGVEVETRLARGLLPHHYEKGWHPTATLGVFGATAAAARMLDFDEEQTTTALAVAVSMASGLKSNFGTPVKPMHVGQAAHNGIMAALITRRGMTANHEAFEHNYGFFNLFNGVGTYDADAILDGWDGPLEVLQPGIAIKQHPCCGSAHSAIDAALSIVAREGLLSAGAIEAIETRTHDRRLAHTNRPQPRSGLDAKFSVQFLTAKALTAGRIRLADFDDAGFLTPDLADLLPRVSSTGHQGTDAYLGHVRVVMKDGRVLEDSASTNFGRGPANPMSDAELGEKFLDCATTRLGLKEAGDVYRGFLELSADSQLGPLLAQLSGGRR
ncbi:2-methylcitrate dehydratase PrpD [Rhizobium petrolearium]|uniref:MmgE/PrpD family protein n=1 Tax=Neorhizobium petrolearium TaxID=515361 RepID=UPI001AE614F8|nr:MmgE/PrpD family protein [Neorhizobium petrolearium]MBP1845624.1 2-methylcitrate dehydratase PrpD [Neorhizobium petrolearium]